MLLNLEIPFAKLAAPAKRVQRSRATKLSWKIPILIPASLWRSWTREFCNFPRERCHRSKWKHASHIGRALKNVGRGSKWRANSSLGLKLVQVLPLLFLWPLLPLLQQQNRQWARLWFLKLGKKDWSGASVGCNRSWSYIFNWIANWFRMPNLGCSLCVSMAVENIGSSFIVARVFYS